MENKCIFNRKYKEPNEKYICFSGTVFIKKGKYERIKNKEIKDVLDDKIISFVQNINRLIDELEKENGIYPSNLYLRLYVDETFSSSKKKDIKLLYKRMERSPKVQLIDYVCPNFKENNSDINHIGLFGTLTRFHAIFDDKSPNMELVCLIDVDNIYTEKYIKLMDNFKRSKKLVLCITTIIRMALYSYDVKKNNMFNFAWLSASLTIIKRHKMFNMGIWEKYIDNMYDQDDLLYIINNLDFKNNYLKEKTEIPTKHTSFNSMEFGIDEIWLNYVIKKVLTDNKERDKLKIYFLNSFNFSIFFQILLSMFRFNHEIKNVYLEKFVENYEILPKKDRTYRKMINDIRKFSNNKKKINKLGEIKKYIFNITSNKYYKKIYIKDNLRFTMNNFNKLLNMRNPENMNNFIIDISK
jgi:hypothetical protein